MDSCLLFGSSEVASVPAEVMYLSTASIDSYTKRIWEMRGHSTDIILSVPESVESVLLDKLIDDDVLLPVTLDAMSSKCVKDGHSAAWVLPGALPEGQAHLADLFHVCDILEAVNVVIFTWAKQSVTPQRVIEYLDVFFH